MRIRGDMLLLAAVLAAVLLAHLATYRPSEPFYNNDETRHVMTGVFLRDLIHDLPLDSPRAHAMRYYMQYPALGIPLYPPFFYVVEGVCMTLFGPSVLVGKVLVVLFLCLACTYLHLLVRRTHDSTHAVLATVIFAFSPLVFELSGHVMLEIPTLALALMAIYHSQRYLDLRSRHDLILAAVGSIAAMLTRFSGVFLVPYFLLVLAARRELHVVARREVALAMGLSLVVVIPLYLFSWLTIGRVHLGQAFHGLGVGSAGMGLLERLTDYPLDLPLQMGWLASVLALVGLALALAAIRTRNLLPYVAVVLSTYLTFSLMAIHSPRFVIYWVPAFALLAAVGIFRLAMWLRFPRAAPLIGFLVVAGVAQATIRAERPYVRGYEAVARYVLSRSQQSRYCLFDGALNGNFIYQMRTNDPDRRVWVLRGDRVLYSVLLQPSLGYKDPLRTEQEMIEAIARYDPEFIVVEDPPTLSYQTLAGQRLRSLLRHHPERYRLALTVPIETNRPEIKGSSLYVYRSLIRTPRPDHPPQFEIPALQKKA